MVKRVMEPEQALREGLSLRWAMVHTAESVYLGETKNWTDGGLRNERELQTELIRARFFEPTREIRLFRTEGELRAVCLEGDDGGEMTIRETRALNPAFGRSIMLAHELAADEDGQVYVEAVRLMRWTGGKGDRD